jgi:hypothetical protein
VTPGPGRVDTLPRACADAVEHRHRRDAGSGVTTVACFLRFRPDHREPREAARERQVAPLVLQQHHRRARCLARDRTVIGVAVPVGRAVGEYARVIEEPELELGSQHARTAASISARAPHPARTRASTDGARGTTTERPHRVPTHRRAWSPSSSRLGDVQHGRARGRGGVGDDEPPRIPSSRLSTVGHQPAVLRGRRHRRRSCTRSSASARRSPGSTNGTAGSTAPRGAIAVIDRVAVAPAFADVRHEVFGRGHDARAFERPHVARPITS